MPRSARITIFLLGILALYFIAVYLRLEVLRYQYDEQRAPGEASYEMPFTLESALQFSMVREVFETGSLTVTNRLVEYPQGVDRFKTYTIGAEYAYAGVARLLPGTWSLQHRVRWASILLFCLGIPALAFWTALLGRSATAGLMAGLLYAIAYASLVRSFGAEISRENLALPVAIFFLALQAAATRVRGNGGFWACIIGSGICLALAFCNWDLIQVIIGLWLASWLIRVAVGLDKSMPDVEWLRLEDDETTVELRARARRRECGRFVIPVIGLALAGLLNPYLQAHGFLFSPIFLLCLGLALWLGLFGWRELSPRRDRLRWIVPLIPLLLFLLFGRNYAQSYSHFGELLSAKIEFDNIKPQDPAHLTFIQRIMWTPALHSSTWPIAFLTFPAVLYLLFASNAIRLSWAGIRQHWGLPLVLGGLPMFILLLYHLQAYGVLAISMPSKFTLGLLMFCGVAAVVLAVRRLEFDQAALLFFCLFSLATFVLFFRFHVFFILFGAAWIGLCAGDLVRWARLGMRPLILSGLGLFLLTVGILIEGDHVLNQIDRSVPLQERVGRVRLFDRPNTRYRDLDHLIALLSDYSEKGAVLANFGVSGSIAAYANCPVLLHPKFETEAIRRRVEEYAEYLFKHDEKAFRDWARRHGAELYVHSRGELVDHPALNSGTLRYMVNALDPPPNAAVRLFEKTRAESSRYFGYLGGNQKYAVYRIVTEKDIAAAKTFVELAHNEYNVALRFAKDVGPNAEGKLFYDFSKAKKWLARAFELDHQCPEALQLTRAIRNHLGEK